MLFTIFTLPYFIVYRIVWPVCMFAHNLIFLIIVHFLRRNDAPSQWIDQTTDISQVYTIYIDVTERGHIIILLTTLKSISSPDAFWLLKLFYLATKSSLNLAKPVTPFRNFIIRHVKLSSRPMEI